MKRHLSYTTLIRLAAGSLSGKKHDAAHAHLANCDDCSATLTALSRIVAPSKIKNGFPMRDLEAKIIRSYRRIAHSQEHLHVKFNLRSTLRERFPPVIAIGILALFIISAWIFATIGSGDGGPPLPINITYLKGKAFINNHEIDSKTRITENCVLRISKNSELVLSYNTSFTIKLGSGSVLEIKKALIGPGKHLMEFVFSLEKGTLFTRFDGINGLSNYFYITPTAHIKSSRTEFILRVAENKTVVIPRSGTLEIKSIASDEEVITLPDKKYVITYSIESGDTNDFDELSMDRLRNMDNPLRAIDMNDILEDFSDSI